MLLSKTFGKFNLFVALQTGLLVTMYQTSMPVQAVTLDRTTQESINASALHSVSRPLNTKLPDASGKRSPIYIQQFEAAQTPRPLGSDPIEKAEPVPGEGAARSNSLSTNVVPLTRPMLSALISVHRNLNPLTLDARLYERVTLDDVLGQTIKQNLQIEGNFSSLKSRQYAVLSAASRFLPDIKSGYQLAGLTGKLPGAFAGGSGGSFGLPSSFQLLNAGFSQPIYQGGNTIFTLLQEKHRYRASRASLKGTVNDVLLESTKRYYDLLYNEALLDIRTRAVEISEEQVRLNELQERAGTATGLDVLQSQAQLSSDQQNLVDQQSARRQSALRLASYINSSLAQDLTSSETELPRRQLIEPSVSVEELVARAIENRPELRQYEELRLAAKRAIGIAQSPLQPHASLNGTVYGIGANGSNLSPIFNLALQINWTLGHLGVQDVANTMQAKWQAREAAVRAKQAFTDVVEQVRTSFVQSLAADGRIEHASAQIAAAEEELRIATKRMKVGVGLNIDVLNAQRDRTQAYINKARAMVDFNIAQAQLLHDTGLISVASLTRGM